MVASNENCYMPNVKWKLYMVTRLHGAFLNITRHLFVSVSISVSFLFLFLFPPKVEEIKNHFIDNNCTQVQRANSFFTLRSILPMT